MKKIITLSLIAIVACSSVFASSGSITPVKENPVPKPPITNTQQKPIKGLIILGDNYAVDDNFVYVVNETRSAWVQMPNADRVTFKVLGGQFARDVDQIFHMGKKIEGALLDSFSVISGQHGYAQDDKRIYGPKGVIKEADPETFKMLTKNYSLDAGHVFFDGVNIPEANAGSFRVIDSGLYAVDDKSVFYAGKLLKNALPEGLIVKWPRAFSANDYVFFEGRVEKGENPIDEPVQPENPETPVPPENPQVETPTADAWSTFWDRFAPYTAKFTGENMAFWTLVVLALLGIFSLIFVFFADRNDEVVSLWKSMVKTLVAGAVMLVTIWVASFFLKPLAAIIIGLVLWFFFFTTLWSALGWIKSLLITILTLIGIIFMLAIGALIVRAVFDDVESFIVFINQPALQLIGIMNIIGFFGGAWLIGTQLGSSLARSIGQAFVATIIATAILGLLIWITNIGTLASIVLFSALYTILLWIMRFRMVSNLFAETVRIVRIGLIIAVTIGLVVWIIL
jgi:hypothetical protein